MPNPVCFTFPDGQRFCIDIPVLINPWPRRPDPEQWVKFEGVDPAVIQDLGRLATMRDIARGLTHDQARPLVVALDAGIEKINNSLPKGYKVNVGH